HPDYLAIHHNCLDDNVMYFLSFRLYAFVRHGGNYGMDILVGLPEFGDGLHLNGNAVHLHMRINELVAFYLVNNQFRERCSLEKMQLALHQQNSFLGFYLTQTLPLQLMGSPLYTKLSLSQTDCMAYFVLHLLSLLECTFSISDNRHFQ